MPPTGRCCGRAFYDADGELLIVPQLGRLLLVTELGAWRSSRRRSAVIPRGVRFRVELPDGAARGYVCENFGAPFRLPDLGPIGSNGLACERDFLTPAAWFEDADADYELVAKFEGRLWSAQHGSFALRCGRLAWQLRALQVRSAALQHHRLDQLRSSRSVDLPGAALAQRHPGSGQTSTS